jgi:hypothetical protein
MVWRIVYSRNIFDHLCTRTHTHTHTHISASVVCTSLLSIRSPYSHNFSDLSFMYVEINKTSNVM